MSDKILGLLKIVTLLLVIITISNHFLFAEIKLLTPSKLDTIFIGNNVKISWSEFIFDGKLEYSTDSGTNWITIADKISGNKYDWIVPFHNSKKIDLRLSGNELKLPFLIRAINKVHKFEVRTSEISQDGTKILSCGDDKKIKIFDINSGKCIDSLLLKQFANVYKAQYFHNPDTILATVDNKLIFWDRVSGKTVDMSGNLFTDIVRSCAVHPYKPLAAASCYDGSVRIFNLRTNQQIISFSVQNDTELYSISFSDDGSKLIYTGYNGDFYINDWENDKIDFFDGKSNNNSQLLWAGKLASDNKFAATAGIDQTVRLWNTESKKLIRTFTGHKSHVRSLDFSSKRKIFLSSSLDHTIRQWLIDDLGEFLEVQIDHSGPVLHSTYSVTTDSIVSSGRDNTIKLWKNYSFIKVNETVSCESRLKFEIEIPEVVSRAGKSERIPILFNSLYNIPELKDWKFDLDIQIEYPHRLMFLLNKDWDKSPTDADTFNINLESVKLIDTLEILRSLTLHSNKNYGEINLLDIRVVNADNCTISKNNGSITVFPRCVGNNEWDIGYSSYQFNMKLKPNPVSESANIQISLIADGFYCLDIVNESGMIIEKLINDYMKHGIYNIELNTQKYSDGVYFIYLQSETKVLSQKMIVTK